MYFNLKEPKPDKPSVKKYSNIIKTFHLKQHILKHTRMQNTLTDH